MAWSDLPMHASVTANSFSHASRSEASAELHWPLSVTAQDHELSDGVRCNLKGLFLTQAIPAVVL